MINDLGKLEEQLRVWQLQFNARKVQNNAPRLQKSKGRLED